MAGVAVNFCRCTVLHRHSPSEAPEFHGSLWMRAAIQSRRYSLHCRLNGSLSFKRRVYRRRSWFLWQYYEECQSFWVALCTASLFCALEVVVGLAQALSAVPGVKAGALALRTQPGKMGADRQDFPSVVPFGFQNFQTRLGEGKGDRGYLSIFSGQLHTRQLPQCKQPIVPGWGEPFEPEEGALKCLCSGSVR